MRYPIIVLTAIAVLTVVPALAATTKTSPFWERGVSATATAPQSDEATAPAPQADPLAEAAVTTADLAAAGFSDPRAVTPGADTYELPTYYFRVAETSSEAAWAVSPNDAANLVAVLVEPLSGEQAAGLAVGQIDYRQLDGRYQARTYRNGRYLVVTGPDGDKVANLIKLLEKKRF